MNPNFHKTASSNHIYYVTTDFKNVILLLERGTRVVIYHYTFFNTKHDVIFLNGQEVNCTGFPFFTQLTQLYLSTHTPNVSDYGLTEWNYFTQLPTSGLHQPFPLLPFPYLLCHQLILPL